MRRKTKHGHDSHAGRIAYRCWKSMLNRCKPTNKARRLYFERGISVCPRWHEFENFYADMGDRPDGMSLDRINNDGNYEPGNVRWATVVVQSNNRRGNRRLEFNGRNMTLCEWAREYGLHPSALRSRLKIGWTIEQAITLPSGSYLAPKQVKQKRSAAVTHCKYGHEYSSENTVFYGPKRQRTCMTCKRLMARRGYHRKKHRLAASHSALKEQTP